MTRSGSRIKFLIQIGVIHAGSSALPWGARYTLTTRLREALDPLRASLARAAGRIHETSLP